MIRVRPSAERGHADHGWLDTRYTFSFANYLDPRHMGFSVLRVINQDVIQAGAGFPTHGHQDMEIITVVLSGALAHRDSMGHGSRIRPGEVQVMSAGTGITHSEFNASETEPLELIQIWILPRKKGATPRYDQKPFAPEELDGRLRLVVSPDGADGSLTIGQDARLHVGRLTTGQSTSLALTAGRSAWVHVARGRLVPNDTPLGPGDGAAVTNDKALDLTGGEDAEVLVFDLPKET